MGSPNSSLVSLCIAINLASSICIVMLNKWIYTHYKFPNMTLTCIHFIFTSVGLSICAKLNMFYPKSIPIRNMLPLSMSFCGFVVLTNLSLQFNTVGTYQLIKVMTMPCIMVIHTVAYGKSYDAKIKSTLVSNSYSYLHVGVLFKIVLGSWDISETRHIGIGIGFLYLVSS